MRVLIIGVAGNLGRLAAECLLTDSNVESVIGLDWRACRPPLPGVRFIRAALHQPEWRSLLREVDAVIDLIDASWPLPRRHDRISSEDHKQVLSAVSSVEKLIIASSVALYGPQPSGWITEDAPIRGHQAGKHARAQALVADFIQAEAIPATQLRSAWMAGPRSLSLTRWLSAMPVPAGGVRQLQVLHHEDWLAALRTVLHTDLPGIVHAGAEDAIPFRDAAALLGQRRVTLLPLTLRAWWDWRVRGRRSPPGWIRALYRAPLLDCSRLRAAGWLPRYTTRETLIEALESLQAGG
jgi:nucleoside-diphosphate-sugar epimerase